MGKRHRALRALLALACAGAVALTALTGAVCAAAGMEREATRSDCIIVLGARVWPDGRLSDSLLYRCEAAFEAYEAQLAPRLIVCGAQGADEPVSEAEAMFEWFVEQGVPPEAIFVEDASRNTEQNLQNAQNIMRAEGMDSAAIVTSDYHLQRALWIAGDLGISACGIAAESPKPLGVWLKNRVREGCSWCVYALRKLF